MTEHAKNRIEGRLNGLVDRNDEIKIENLVRKYQSTSGKFYFVIKTFGKLVRLPNDINGDGIVAVVKDGNLKTVMLARTYKTQYFNDGKLIFC